jgi:hypothetical protein
MYQTIIKEVTQYFKSINPQEINKLGIGNIAAIYGSSKNYSDLIRKLVKRVVDFSLADPAATSADPRLERYIVFDMPKLIVKYELQLFVDETDPHRNISSLSQIFEPIKELLINNPAIKLPENNSLIRNLDNYILPYYNETITTLVPMMKVVLDNYNRFIINDSRLVNIMNTLVQKAVTETQ